MIKSIKNVMLSIITLPIVLGWVAIVKIQQLVAESYPEFANSDAVEVVGCLVIAGLIYLVFGKLIVKLIKCLI